MTPESWRKVRLVPGSNPRRLSVRLFFTHFEIGPKAKEFLGLPLATENLTRKTALEVGELFEAALRKVEEAALAKKKGLK